MSIQALVLSLAGHDRRTQRHSQLAPYPNPDVVLDGKGVALEGDLVRHVQAATDVNEQGSADLLQQRQGKRRDTEGERLTHCS